MSSSSSPDDGNDTNNESTGSSSAEENTSNPVAKIDVATSLKFLSEFPNVVYEGLSNGIGLSVKATNTLLANLQSTTETMIQKPMAAGLHSLQTTSDQAQRSCRILYDRRHEFAPYYVVGTTLGVGGLARSRSRPIPSVCLGLLAGGITYMSLYDPITEPPKFWNNLEKLQVNWTEKLREWTGATNNNSNKKE